MTEPGTSPHTDVGAYALGLLEPPDRVAFEEHLRGCPACEAELAELAGMKDLLTGIGPVEDSWPAAGPAAGEAAAGPAAANVTDLVRRRAVNQRRHTRRQVLLSAAASVALLAGGLAAGVLLARQPPAPGNGNPPGSVTVAAVDRSTGVHGRAVLVAKPFGAQITVDLKDIRGPLECQFFAVSKAGARFMIGTWFLPPKVDFGSPKHPAPLHLEGWTTIKFSDIAKIEVVAKGHGTQVSIPV